MPFTFSHPAAVLPLRILPRHWFSFTGLIIGSLVPDFEYFLRMKVKSNFSHTLPGIFLFDLPAGIALTFIFYYIIIGPLLENTPPFLSCRFSFLKNSGWGGYFKTNSMKVCFCILAGAISHVIWDNFTHEHGYFAQIIPRLSKSKYLFGLPVISWHMLQHLSSIAGGLIVLVYVWQLRVDESYTPKPSLKYWSIATLAFVVFILLRIRLGLGDNWLNNFAVSCISAGMLSILLSSFLFPVKNKL